MTFPVDITELLRNRLARDRRPPDGKLHPSGDLIGSLRHSQLRAAGAPTIESDITSSVRLMTGTNWHTFMEDTFNRARLPVMTEVKLDKWLPEGWSGTADWIVWNDDLKAFELGDLKTIKGEGMKYVMQEGMKDEHLWQLSSYWYALERMGIPLVKRFHVYYLPMNAPVKEFVEPAMQMGKPLDRALVLDTMESRWVDTKAYLTEVRKAKATSLKEFSVWDPWEKTSDFLNEHLAPVQERIQILRWNATQTVFDLKLAAHWSAMYCPYPNELCDCSEQGSEKIGHYYYDFAKGETFYLPRKGYQAIQPKLTLSVAQQKTLQEKTLSS